MKAGRIRARTTSRERRESKVVEQDDSAESKKILQQLEHLLEQIKKHESSSTGSDLPADIVAKVNTLHTLTHGHVIADGSLSPGADLGRLSPGRHSPGRQSPGRRSPSRLSPSRVSPSNDAATPVLEKADAPKQKSSKKTVQFKEDVGPEGEIHFNQYYERKRYTSVRKRQKTKKLLMDAMLKHDEEQEEQEGGEEAAVKDQGPSHRRISNLTNLHDSGEMLCSIQAVEDRLQKRSRDHWRKTKKVAPGSELDQRLRRHEERRQKLFEKYGEGWMDGEQAKKSEQFVQRQRQSSLTEE